MLALLATLAVAAPSAAPSAVAPDAVARYALHADATLPTTVMLYAADGRDFAEIGAFTLDLTVACAAEQVRGNLVRSAACEVEAADLDLRSQGMTAARLGDALDDALVGRTIELRFGRDGVVRTVAVLEEDGAPSLNPRVTKMRACSGGFCVLGDRPAPVELFVGAAMAALDVGVGEAAWTSKQDRALVALLGDAPIGSGKVHHVVEADADGLVVTSTGAGSFSPASTAGSPMAGVVLADVHVQAIGHLDAAGALVTRDVTVAGSLALADVGAETYALRATARRLDPMR